MENLNLLSKITLSFQNLNDFEKGINEILEDIGKLLDLSRIYIFLNDNEEIVSNTFEWCKKGVIPQKQELQKISKKIMPSFDKTIKSDGYIFSNDINNLPQDMIDILKQQEIKSIVVYPLKIKKEIIGFIGFNECRYKRDWKKEELEILKTISGFLSNAYQRKIAQKDLMDSETNFRMFFETTDHMFIVSDLYGNIIHCNKSLIDKLGYSLLELKNMNSIELHPIEERKKVYKSVTKLVKKEAEYLPLNVIAKSGERYSLETRIWIGKWTGDIECNEYWSIISGYSLEELEPICIETWIEKTHPEDLIIANEMLEKHLSGQSEYYECEMRMKHKDGRWIWTQARGKVIERDYQGKPLKMFGKHSDISLRKQIEKTLKENEKRFFLALDKTEAGLWDIDLINGTIFLSSSRQEIIF